LTNSRRSQSEKQFRAQGRETAVRNPHNKKSQAHTTNGTRAQAPAPHRARTISNRGRAPMRARWAFAGSLFRMKRHFTSASATMYFSGGILDIHLPPRFCHIVSSFRGRVGRTHAYMILAPRVAAEFAYRYNNPPTKFSVKGPLVWHSLRYNNPDGRRVTIRGRVCCKPRTDEDGSSHTRRYTDPTNRRFVRSNNRIRGASSRRPCRSRRSA